MAKCRPHHVGACPDVDQDRLAEVLKDVVAKRGGGLDLGKYEQCAMSHGTQWESLIQLVDVIEALQLVSPQLRIKPTTLSAALIAVMQSSPKVSWILLQNKQTMF